MNDKLREIIFKKLYLDLSHLEIIDFDDRIWFIDRGEEYWYLIYNKSGRLWWRYDFFTNFFALFSIEQSEFELIITDLVEEILNYKVSSTKDFGETAKNLVEEALNHKVSSTVINRQLYDKEVREVLNHKVSSMVDSSGLYKLEVREVLNHNKYF